MSEPNFESLATHLKALETAIRASSRTKRASKDWRKVIGMFQDSEFMREVDEECQRLREREREEARGETSPK